jgi:dUTP pyrophosphatase
MKVKFIRFDEDAKIPVRKHYSDTGADIEMPSSGVIFPYETVVIPLGFGIEIPNGHTARLQVRTSVAQKGIMMQGCAIDAGYTGQIHMILHNISKKPFQWSRGDRLGYIEVYPVQYPEFIEFVGEERGNDAFGSTGI